MVSVLPIRLRTVYMNKDSIFMNRRSHLFQLGKRKRLTIAKDTVRVLSNLHTNSIQGGVSDTLCPSKQTGRVGTTCGPSQFVIC